MAGWIRLERKLLQGDIGSDPNLYQVWTRLLLSAEWRDRKVKMGKTQITVLRGQVAVSVRQLADSTGLSVSTVHRCMKYLQNTNRIRTLHETRGTIVTILKYNRYQSLAEDVETPYETQGGTVPELSPNGPRTVPEHSHEEKPIESTHLQPPNKLTKEQLTKEQRTSIKSPSSPMASEGVSESNPSLKLKQPKEKTAGSIAFESYAKHYELRYKVKPLRDRMANVHCKSIAESIPKDDIDGFFASYLGNPDAFFVQKAHPLSLARTNVQKIYTELQTGLRLSAQRAKTYERDQNNTEQLQRHMERKYGNAQSTNQT